MKRYDDIDTLIMVTGTEQDPPDLRMAVRRSLNGALTLTPDGGKMLVVHGGCHTGTDAVAQMWAYDTNCLKGSRIRIVKSFKTYSPGAEHSRNKRMVDWVKGLKSRIPRLKVAVYAYPLDSSGPLLPEATSLAMHANLDVFFKYVGRPDVITLNPLLTEKA